MATRKKNPYNDYGLQAAGLISDSSQPLTSDNPYEEYGQRSTTKERDPKLNWDWKADAKAKEDKQAAAKKKAEEDAKAKAAAEQKPKKEDSSIMHRVASGIADIWQADSAADKQRRVAAGQPAEYKDQQAQKKQTADAFTNDTKDQFDRANTDFNLAKDEIDARRDHYKSAGIDIDQAVKDKAEYDKFKADLDAGKTTLVRATLDKKIPEGAKRYDAERKKLKKAETTYQRNLKAAAGAESTVEQVERGFVRGAGTPLAEIPSNVETLAGSAIKAVAPDDSKLQDVGESVYDRGVVDRNKLATQIVTSGHGAQAADNPITSGFSEGAGSLFAALTAAKFFKAPSVAATMFGVNQGADQAVASQQAGKSDAQSFATGAVAGAAEGLLEKFGLDKFLGASGGVVKKTATRMITEGVQEATQSLAQSGINMTYKDVDLQQALQQALTEGGIGAVIGGGAGLPMAISENLQQQGVDADTALRTGLDVQDRMERVINEEKGNDVGYQPKTPAATLQNAEPGDVAPGVVPDPTMPQPGQVIQPDPNDAPIQPAAPIAQQPAPVQPTDTQSLEDMERELADLPADSQRYMNLADKIAELKQQQTAVPATPEAPAPAADVTETPRKPIGLGDDGPGYTPRMKQLIREAQDNDEPFPYTKMTSEEQDIVNGKLSSLVDEAKARHDAGAAKPTHPKADFDKDKFDHNGHLTVNNGNSSAMIKKETIEAGGKRVDAIEITAINSTKARTGSATALMDDIKAFATEHDMPIVLTAVATPKSAYGRMPNAPQEPMKQKDLQAWYERQGFKPLGGNQYAWKAKKAKPASSAPAAENDAVKLRYPEPDELPDNIAALDEVKRNMGNGPRVSKSDVRMLIKHIPGLKKNPRLSVIKDDTYGALDTDLLFNYKDDTNDLKLKPNALGFDESRLADAGIKAGMTIDLSDVVKAGGKGKVATIQRGGQDYFMPESDDSGRPTKTDKTDATDAAELSKQIANIKEAVYDEETLVKRRQERGQELDDQDRAALAAAADLHELDQQKATAGAIRRHLQQKHKSLHDQLAKELKSLEKSAVDTPAPLTRQDRKQIKADANANIKAVDAKLKLRADAKKVRVALYDYLDEDWENEDAVMAAAEQLPIKVQFYEDSAEIRYSGDDIMEAQVVMAALGDPGALNDDGTITLYHGTSDDGKAYLDKSGLQAGTFLAGIPDVYGPDGFEGAGFYGANVVTVHADPRKLYVNDRGEYVVDDPAGAKVVSWGKRDAPASGPATKTDKTELTDASKPKNTDADITAESGTSTSDQAALKKQFVDAMENQLGKYGMAGGSSMWLDNTFTPITIRADELQPEPDNNAQVDKYVRQIKAGGRPVVYVERSDDGGYDIVDGNHKATAYQMAGVEEIPAVLLTPPSSSAAAERYDPALMTYARKFDSAQEFIGNVRGSATQYGEYHPELRVGGSHPNAMRLDKLGVDPDSEVTIYRGIDDRTGSVARKINNGDFVTADYDSALAYTGDPKDVVSMTVKAGDLFAEDADEFREYGFYEGAEFIYSNDYEAAPQLTDEQLTAIYDAAQKPDRASADGLIDPGTPAPVRAPVAERFNKQARQDAMEALDEIGTASKADQPEKLGRKDARPAAELVHLADQLNKAAQKGAILRRGGAKSKKYLGVFTRKGGDGKDPKTAIDPHIKLRDSVIQDPHQYAHVLAHELSHATEFYINGNTRSTYKLFGDLTAEEKTQITNELKTVVDALDGADVAQAKPEYFYKPTEMLARYVELRFIYPGKANLMAPLVSTKYDDLIMREPMIQDLMAAVEGKIDHKYVNWTPSFLKDVRQIYRKKLGKSVGDVSYNAEVVRRAEVQRSSQLIGRLIKQKFKGIKDDPADLFHAAEAILVTENGTPQFGTHDFMYEVKDDDLRDLQKAGWEVVASRDVGEIVFEGVVVGMKQEHDLSRQRYTPEQAEKIFNDLSPAGQQLIKDFTAAKEEAKDEFNRELMKDLYHIDSKVEGWVHHYFEGKPMAGNKKTTLRHKVAAAKKQRQGAEGYIEDFRKATEKALLELDRNEINNSFIRDQLARISKPIAKGEKPDPGWVEVVADEKGGLRLPGEGMQIIIKPDEGKAIRVPQKRYQVPEDLVKHYRELRDVPGEVNKAALYLNRVAKYWTLNVLIHPGTVSTNFISGGLQYGAKIMNDFYLDLLTANFSMNRTRHNLIAPLQVLTPRGWTNAPDWLYGGYRAGTQGGQAAIDDYAGQGKIDQGIEQYGNKMLAAFSIVETYWKKTIALSEGGKLSSATNRRITDRLREDEVKMVEALNEAIDTYAFDYDNKPLWMSQFDRRGGKIVKPFMTYPYKYTKFVTSFAAAGFDRTLPWEQRTAKILTLATIVAAIAALYHDREDDMKTPKGTEKTPLGLKPGGRLMVGTAKDGEELFVRTAKYPFFNLTSLGRTILDRNGSEASGLLNEMFATVGPGFDLFMLATGRADQFSQFTPASERVGEMVGSFIPGFRILNDAGKLLDDKSRKPKTFIQGIGSQLPIWGSEEDRAKLRGEIRTIKIPDEPEGGRSIAKSARTVTTRDVKTYDSDTLLSLLTGVYVRRINPKEARQQELRELRDQAEDDIRHQLAAGNEADAEALGAEYGLEINDKVKQYYRTQRRKAGK